MDLTAIMRSGCLRNVFGLLERYQNSWSTMCWLVTALHLEVVSTTSRFQSVVPMATFKVVLRQTPHNRLFHQFLFIFGFSIIAILPLKQLCGDDYTATFWRTSTINGTGVTSRIAVTSRPAAASANSRLDLSGPLTVTSTDLSPCSWAAALALLMPFEQQMV